MFGNRRRYDPFDPFEIFNSMSNSFFQDPFAMHREMMARHFATINSMNAAFGTGGLQQQQQFQQPALIENSQFQQQPLLIQPQQQQQQQQQQVIFSQPSGGTAGGGGQYSYQSHSVSYSTVNGQPAHYREHKSQTVSSNGVTKSKVVTADSNKGIEIKRQRVQNGQANTVVETRQLNGPVVVTEHFEHVGPVSTPSSVEYHVPITYSTSSSSSSASNPNEYSHNQVEEIDPSAYHHHDVVHGAHDVEEVEDEPDDTYYTAEEVEAPENGDDGNDNNDDDVEILSEHYPKKKSQGPPGSSH